MKKNIIFHHLGLGDHIICNGLVRYLSKNIYTDEEVYIFCKPQNSKSIEFMYRDNPLIKLILVQDMDFIIDRSDIDYWITTSRIDFDVGFYDVAKVPFSARWDYWYFERDKQKELELEEKLNLPEEYVLIHDTSSVRKFDLDKIKTKINKIYVNPITDCIFDWIGVAKKAKEIHCIDSSFMQMAISEIIDVPIFYHDIRTTTSVVSYRDNVSRIYYHK